MTANDFSDDALLDLVRRYRSGEGLDEERLDSVAAGLGLPSRRDLGPLLAVLGALPRITGPRPIPEELDERLRDHLLGLLEDRPRHPVDIEGLGQVLVRCIRDRALRARLVEGPAVLEELAGIRLTARQHADIVDLLRPDQVGRDGGGDDLEERVAAIVLRFASRMDR